MPDTKCFPMSALCAALLLFANTSHAVVSPTIEVHAIVERGDGKPSELRVVDGGVLRSGDRLQVRVRAPQDGYVYVIAYGSSGSALLLHPFAGRTETARVRADKEMIVPDEGVYLPLDGRPGREVLFAIWSPAPLQGISSLLVRMEGAAGDSERAEQMLRDVYPDARRVAFRHLDSKPLYGVDLVSTGMAKQYQATGTIAPLEDRAAVNQQRADPYAITSTSTDAPVGATLEGLSVATPAPVISSSGPGASAAAGTNEPDLDKLLLEPAPEEGVLGGVGSRLRAFETGQDAKSSSPPAPVIVEPAVVPPTSSQSIGPGASGTPRPTSELSSQASPPETMPPSPPSGSGLTAAIAAFFGGDTSPAAKEEPAVARTGSGAGLSEAAATSSARVLPLADAAPTPASSPVLQLQVPAVTTATEGLVTQQPAGPAASSVMTAAGPVAGATVVTAPAAAAGNTQAPDPSESGVAIRPALVSPPAAEAGSLTQPSAPRVTASAAPALQAPSSPAPSAASSSPKVTSYSPASQTPMVATTGGTASIVDANATPVSEQAPDSSPDLFGALASWLEPSASRPVSGGRNQDGGMGATAVPVIRSGGPVSVGSPDAPSATSTSSARAAESESVAVTTTRLAPATASSGEASAVPRPSDVAPEDRSSVETKIAATAVSAPPPTPKATPTPPTADAGTGDGGLFSALGSLFAASSPPTEPRDTAPALDAGRDDTAGELASAATQGPAPIAEVPGTGAVAEPATASTGDGGVLGSLGRLFGFDDGQSTTTPAGSEQAPTGTASMLPGNGSVTPMEAPRPAVNLEKGVVVRLDGPASKPQVPPPQPAGAVLGDEGNRIRALLGETPQPEAPPPTPAAVASESRPAPALVMTSSASPVATSRAVSAAPGTPAVVVETPAASRVAAPSSAATVPVPSLTASVSAPAPSVSVAPPLPGLAAGGAAPAPQLATLSTAQSIEAARGVARGVVMVVTPEGSGSGALIDGAGHVLTNWHLVGGYSAVTVLVKSATGDLPDRARPIRARVVRFSKFADLALLKLDNVPDSAAPLVLGDGSTLRAGSMLHAIGHPDGSGWSHTPIIVTRVREQGSWYSGQSFLFKAAVVSGQAHADPGANGTALFDAEMQLVALGATSTRRGDKVQAVSIDTIRSFLQGTATVADVATGG